MSSIGVFGSVTSASEYVSTMATAVQLCFECVDDVNEELEFRLGRFLQSIWLCLLE